MIAAGVEALSSFAEQFFSLLEKLTSECAAKRDRAISKLDEARNQAEQYQTELNQLFPHMVSSGEKSQSEADRTQSEADPDGSTKLGDYSEGENSFDNFCDSKETMTLRENLGSRMTDSGYIGGGKVITHSEAYRDIIAHTEGLDLNESPDTSLQGVSEGSGSQADPVTMASARSRRRAAKEAASASPGTLAFLSSQPTTAPSTPTTSRAPPGGEKSRIPTQALGMSSTSSSPSLSRGEPDCSCGADESSSNMEENSAPWEKSLRRSSLDTPRDRVPWDFSQPDPDPEVKLAKSKPPLGPIKTGSRQIPSPICSSGKGGATPSPSRLPRAQAVRVSTPTSSTGKARGLPQSKLTLKSPGGRSQSLDNTEIDSSATQTPDTGNKSSSSNMKRSSSLSNRPEWVT